MLKLYHHPASVTSAKVRMVLAQKNVDWAGAEVDLYRGEQFDPSYIELNPAALVPTLVADGRPVRESVAICEYLEEAFPETALAPADYVERARMRVLCKDVETFMSVAAAGVIFPANDRFEVEKLSASELDRYYAGHPNKKLAERKREWMVQGFASSSARQAVLTYNKFLYKLELQLERSPWLIGERFTMADAAALPYVAFLELLGMGEWVRRMKRVAEWYGRASQRPSFETAVVRPIPRELRKLMQARGEAAWPEVDAILATAEPFTGKSPWAMRADAI